MNQFEYKDFPDWTTMDDKDVYKSLFAQVQDFNGSFGNTISDISLRGMRQYLGRNIASLNTNGYMSTTDARTRSNGFTKGPRASYNLTASAIDTLTAKLASNSIVPQAVTYKGNAAGRALAEDLNFILKGVFHKYRITHLINLAYRDAMINRAGYLKYIVEDGDLRVDRVYIDEIIVDPADGYYNNPYKLVHRKTIPVAVMLQNYPKFSKEIQNCSLQQNRQFQTRNYTPVINVLEGWCKNTYMKGGRHVISIENTDLLDEEWDNDFFPIQKCNYLDPTIGWMGKSVVDILAPIQCEVDRILFTMQSIMQIVSVPRIFFDNNSGVNLNHMTNQIGSCIGYDGKNGVAPIINNGAGMPPELPAQLKNLIGLGMEEVGLTTMDTQGQQKTGSGNQSGEALKTMVDIKSERWALLQKNYENSHVEAGRIILNLLKGTNLKISALDRHIGLKPVSTKKIPKTEDSYVLKVFPVSEMPKSIPDLIDSVERMMNLGVIQPSQVPELFQMPDVDAYVTMQSAPTKLIDKKIEEMLEGGSYWNPEPYHNLEYALAKALQHYNWGQLNDESDKNLAKLRKFINDVETLLAQKAPQPAAVSQLAQPTQPQLPQ